MEDIFTILSAVPNGAVYALALSLLIPLLVQSVKKRLDVQSDKVITTLVGLFSFAGVAIEGLISATAVNPTMLGKDTFMVVGIISFVYRFLIKPASKFTNDVREFRERKVRLDAEKAATAAAAAVPVVTLPDDVSELLEETPLTPAPVVTDEFAA